MSVQLDHTIVWCSDKRKSTRFLMDILGFPEPIEFGHMLVVQLDNDVSLDFFERDGAISMQHYAFLVSSRRQHGRPAFGHVRAYIRSPCGRDACACGLAHEEQARSAARNEDDRHVNL
jgi:hypothetical protein